MSELIFGPSADWLGLTGECVQPRLDGGYDYPPIRKLGSIVCESFFNKVRHDPNQPTLFDDLENVVESSEINIQPELFDEQTE